MRRRSRSRRKGGGDDIIRYKPQHSLHNPLLHSLRVLKNSHVMLGIVLFVQGTCSTPLMCTSLSLLPHTVRQDARKQKQKQKNTGHSVLDVPCLRGEVNTANRDARKIYKYTVSPTVTS